MYNPYALERMARDHHKELLKEAEDYRKARMAKLEGQQQISLFHRLLTIFHDLIFPSKSQETDRVSFSPTEAKTSGSL